MLPTESFDLGARVSELSVMASAGRYRSGKAGDDWRRYAVIGRATGRYDAASTDNETNVRVHRVALRIFQTSVIPHTKPEHGGKQERIKEHGK